MLGTLPEQGAFHLSQAQEALHLLQAPEASHLSQALEALHLLQALEALHLLPEAGVGDLPLGPEPTATAGRLPQGP